MFSRFFSFGFRQVGIQILGGGFEFICLSIKVTIKGFLWTVGFGMKGRYFCYLVGFCKKFVGDVVVFELFSGIVILVKDFIVIM